MPPILQVVDLRQVDNAYFCKDKPESNSNSKHVYVVVSLKNKIEPLIGTILTKDDIRNLISNGVQVNIK